MRTSPSDGAGGAATLAENGHHAVVSVGNAGCGAGAFRDALGERRPLLSLWSDRKAVVVFLRHFGCRFCKQQAAGLARVHERLRAAAAEARAAGEEAEEVAVVGIGLGTAAQAQLLREQTGFAGELYADEEPFAPRTYATFALRGGPATLFSAENGFKPPFRPEVAAAAEAALAEGFRDTEGAFEGDTKQVGGAFVLGPGNCCDFARRSEYAGDHVDLKALLAAATGQQAATGHSGGALTYPATDGWVQRLAAAQRMPGNTPLQEAVRRRARLAARRRRRRLLAYGCFGAAFTIVASQCVPGLGALWLLPTSWSVPVVLLLVLMLAMLHASSAAKQLARAVEEAGRAAPGAAGGSGASAGGASAGAAAAPAEAERRGPAKRTPSPPPPAGRERAGDSDLELVTVRDVDALLLAAGPDAIVCDCASLVSSTDYVSKTVEEATAAETGDGDDALPVRRARSASTHSRDDLAALQEFVCYMREFLAKPHPLLGRGGPTCPFVPRSLRLDSIHMGVVRSAPGAGAAKQKAAAVAAARSLVGRFERLPPYAGSAAVHKAVVLLFPDVREKDAHVVIDEVQCELKPLFVAKGLMIGEFHARNNASGLRNPDFFPLRTPTPALAVRNIVPSDIAFLSLEKYEAGTRVAFLESFLGRFGERDEHGEPLRDSELAKIAKAREDLEEARAEVLAAHGADHFARLFE